MASGVLVAALGIGLGGAGGVRSAEGVITLIQALILAGGWLILGSGGKGPRRAGRMAFVLAGAVALLGAGGWGGSAHLPRIPALEALALAASALALAGARDWRWVNLGATFAVAAVGLASFALLESVAGVPAPLSAGRPGPVAVLCHLVTGLAGIGLVLEAGVRAWPLASFRQEPQGTGEATLAWGPFLVFLACVASIGLVGAFHFRSEIRATRRALRSEMRAITVLKVRQLAYWFQERDPRASGLQGEPAKPFLSLLDFWPNPGTRARTFLLSREGMGGSRGFDPQAGGGAEPVPVPSNLVREGFEGILELPDRRGSRILASLAPVPGTPWEMVVQMDQDEILGSFRRDAIRDFLFLAGITTGLALAFRAWLRDREQERLRSLWATRQERKVLEDRLDLLMRQGSDILFLLDLDGVILDANARAVETYGLSAEAMKGRAIRTFRAPSEAPDFEAAFATARGGRPTHYETVHVLGKGDPFPVEVHLRPVVLGEEPYVAAFIRDITERTRKANELRRINRLYATLSQINQAILTCKAPGELFEQVVRILVETGQFRMAWTGLRHGGQEAFLASAALRAETGGLPRLDLAHGGRALAEGDTIILNRLDGPGGGVPWRGAAAGCGIASAAGIPIRRGDAVFGGLVVFAGEADCFGQEEVHLLDEAARDVAFALQQFEKDEVRKRAEAALRENQAFLNQAQEVGMVGTYRFDIPGDRWESSPYLDRLFGIPPEHPRTMESWLGLVEPDSREAMRSYLEGIVRDRVPFDRDYPIVRFADGEIRWLHGRGELVPDESGAPFRMVGVIQDITQRVKADQDRRDLEVHLQRVQQLESLGILAGGIAHDMNNVLAAILALASIQAGAAPADSPQAKAMDTIIKACNRGRDVVKGILFFARRNLAEVTDLDLNVVARDISQLLSYTTLKKVNLRLDLEPDLGTLRADGAAIAHALMNLCVNAVDAMPGGGNLLIRTGSGPGGAIDLEVRDTGEGMTPEVLKRAMEPFYTTKPQGKGTGLGLAMVYGTMKAHDGDLVVSSRPGEGTSAILRFPESRKVRAAVRHAPSPLDVQAGRALRILLVEDDPLVQETTSELLVLLGHQVDVAGNGLEALDWLRRGHAADVVILDMNMPILNGSQALPRILDLRPDQNVIIVTGYLDAGIGALLAEFPSVLALEKPFSIRELASRLGELGGAGRTGPSAGPAPGSGP